jgi:three-Cys-motif partner protein
VGRRMRSPEQFGGRWTEHKLLVLQKYLRAYVSIFTRNPWAKVYHTVYLDAFAGAGYIRRARAGGTESELFPDLASEEATAFIEGSARRALELEPGFNEYLFIDQDEGRCAELRALGGLYAGKNVRIENADANQFLKDWCARMNWKRVRAVVFLDPFGMEVAWETVESIAATEAIDLWYLFPLGAVMRLLTQDQPPSAWRTRLSTVLGATNWEQKFYHRQVEPGLFGQERVVERRVDAESVGRFFIERLNSIFSGVAPKPLLLRNSKNAPLYLFCFAAGNRRGAPTAVKIASDLIRSMGSPHRRGM